MVKHKLFVVDIKKEEAWINQYVKQGYRLVKVKTMTGYYQFEQDTLKSKSHKVKIDFRTFRKIEDFNDYIAMFEDSGWKHIAGTKSNGIQYFERTDNNISEDIFSDEASKAELYKRIANMWFGLFVAYIPILVAFGMTGTLKIYNLFHLKELYYTPGLWDRTGIDFWKAFWFETPFALGRGFFGLLFFIIVLSYAYCALKALFWYYKEKQVQFP